MAMYLNTLNPQPRRIENVEEMYDLWISGSSLRTIGRRFGFSQVAVYKAIARKYGVGATSLQNSSMLRSMVADYGALDPKFVASLAKVEGVYYSQRTINGYTRNWGKLEENYDYYQLAKDFRYHDEPLRWYYLSTIVDFTVAWLYQLQEDVNATAV